MKLRIFRCACVAAIVVAIVAAMVTWTGTTVPAFAAHAGNGNARGASIFHSNCLVCHGADGKGSALGKSINTPDLQSMRVRKQSNALLAHIVSDGNGRMPAFKNRLDDRQIADVIQYIRSFRAK